MKVYLAGEHPVKNGSVALQNYIGGGMDIYLVNPSSRPYTVESNPSLKSTSVEKVYDINILESFYYARDNKTLDRLLPYFQNFLLDSGAFTFMSNSKIAVDWDAYTSEYAEYINRHNIKLFFELDIDSIVGLAEVERLRNKLESLTGKKPIPVWHVSRGKEYFVKMCQNYPYVAFGGILTDGFSTKTIERALPWFIQTAHKHGSKIHGLGYTRLGMLHKFHFDSVDSTAWLYGNRGGFVYQFNPRTGIMDKVDVPAGMRMKSREVAMHNFNEWVKFSRYADKML